MTELLDVEFVDRYGSAGPPSWLRGCHGDCEATGLVPVFNDIHVSGDGDARPRDPMPLRYASAWDDVHGAEPHECDGWHFLKCSDCNGVGRVSWFVTLLRIPRWLYRGIGGVRELSRREISPPDWSAWKRFKLALWCCYGADLQTLWR